MAGKDIKLLYDIKKQRNVRGKESERYIDGRGNNSVIENKCS